MARGLQGKDFEAHYVWGRQHSGPGDVAYHLLDFARNRGHEPSWTVATAFSLARIHRVARIIVDAVAYQRTLKWILEQEMKKRGIYYQVIPIADGMKKFARISNVMSGLASNGQLWIGSEHSIFAQQFEEFGPTYTGHDDDLDASALALQDISNPYLERLSESGDDLLDDVAELSMIRACP
jgi:predicted phage terminase large subunit-like protein